jgi:ATP-binding cassette, subfamily B, multidrug efflux pump
METRLIKYLLKYKYQLLIGVLLIAVVNVLITTIPMFQAKVIDLLVDKTIDKNILLNYMLIILSVAAGAFICSFLAQYMILGSNFHFVYSMRRTMFSHSLNLPMNYFTQNGTGETMALYTNDLTNMRTALIRCTNIAANMLMLYTMAAIRMSAINTKLMLIVMLPFPFAILIILLIGPIIRKKHLKMRETFADLTNLAQENITSIQLVKAFTKETNETERFRKKNLKNFWSHMDLAKITSFFMEIIYLISSISILILLFVGGEMVIDSKITIGEFIACNTYILMMIGQIAMVGMFIDTLQQSKASWERLSKFLAEPQETPDYTSEEHFRQTHNIKDMLDGDICFNNLSFTYEGEKQPALKNINLNIEKGTSIGIVGRIGSGKTTLVNLITRLYEIENANELIINGHCIKDIPRSVLRESIGYVPQDNFLFSDTIHNNIDFNSVSRDKDQVYNAAKTSQIHDTVVELSEGYNTKLGERGVNVSGGQKQRLSIARALVRDASIVILDDSLSAVDTYTEEKILNELKPYTKNKTTLIISHRISTVKHCDRIIVLDKGAIVEEGAHDKLLKHNGLYKEIFDFQQLESEIGKEESNE